MFASDADEDSAPLPSLLLLLLLHLLFVEYLIDILQLKLHRLEHEQGRRRERRVFSELSETASKIDLIGEKATRTRTMMADLRVSESALCPVDLLWRLFFIS